MFDEIFSESFFGILNQGKTFNKSCWSFGIVTVQFSTKAFL